MSAADCYWWVEPVVNFLAIVVGACLVVYQMKRQHHSGLAVQQKQSQNQLKLEVYEKIASQIDEAQDKLISLYSEISSLPSKIEFYWKMKEEWKIDPAPIQVTGNVLIEKKTTSHTIVTKLIFTLEKYEAALFDLENFYLAFRLQGNVLDETFRAFLLSILPFLPSEVPSEKASKLGSPITTPQKPNPDEFKNLKDKATDYRDSALDLVAYIKDLGIEAQNHLVGGLFSKSIPARMPNDPNCIVIRPGAEGKKCIEKAYNKLR